MEKFYQDAIGKTVVNQWIDETGAWIKFSDSTLMRVHDNEIADDRA